MTVARGLARTWCEVDLARLRANTQALLGLLTPTTKLAAVVKADAYGHGLSLAARAFVAGGAHWLAVDSLEEAERLNAAGFDQPTLVMGWLPPEAYSEAVRLGVRVVVYDRETINGLARAAEGLKRTVPVHLKLETGNNRQGVRLDEALALAAQIARSPGVVLEGLSTHFADIEDTTDHTFARRQLELFQENSERLGAAGHRPSMVHAANSAATLLCPESHLNLVRPGIASYGMWPSRETFISALMGRNERVVLSPALTWKTRIAQVRAVAAGESIGYGRTHQVTHPIRLAVLPVGYYDGYDRRLSNLAYVLVGGRRAPVLGRVCMNMVMVDVTDIPGAAAGHEVVLLGEQGSERVSAETLADWVGTINYEVTTRIAPHVPRVPVGDLSHLDFSFRKERQ